MMTSAGTSGPPALVILQGHTASGKSTLARALTELDPERVCAVHSAVVRKELGLSAHGQYRFDLTDPHFTREISGPVYAELLARAAEGAKSRDVVVLDAAYNFYAQRLPVYTLAANLGLMVVAIRCDCPDVERVRERLARRKLDPLDPFNEATEYETYRSTLEHAEDVRGDRERLPRPGTLLEYDSQSGGARCLYSNAELPAPLAGWLCAHSHCP